MAVAKQGIAAYGHNSCDKSRIDTLRLARSERVGAKTFDSLVQLYGSPSAALDALPDMSLRGGRRRPIKVCPHAKAVREWEQVQGIGGKIITFEDSIYPNLLRNIEGYPPVLSVLGDERILRQDAVAMVGSRNASTPGYHYARQLAKEFAKREVVVVSGLARGIDTAVHEGALGFATIAVTATGIDQIYPRSNTALHEEMMRSGKGVVVTEMPFGSLPKAAHFPRRNRIISGIAFATIVVEAHLRSGSLITASNALEQGRDVFAVPGFPMDSRSKGTNNLIKQGAYLLDSVQDVLEHFQKFRLPTDFCQKDEVSVEHADQSSNLAINDQEVQEAHDIILQALTKTPVTMEQLTQTTQIPMHVMLAAIVDLELVGKVERYSGNKIARIYQDLLDKDG